MFKQHLKLYSESVDFTNDSYAKMHGAFEIIAVKRLSHCYHVLPIAK